MTKYLVDIVDLISLADQTRTLRSVCDGTRLQQDFMVFKEQDFMDLLLDYLAPVDAVALMTQLKGTQR